MASTRVVYDRILIGSLEDGSVRVDYSSTKRNSRKVEYFNRHSFGNAVQAWMWAEEIAAEDAADAKAARLRTKLEDGPPAADQYHGPEDPS